MLSCLTTALASLVSVSTILIDTLRGWFTSPSSDIDRAGQTATRSLSLTHLARILESVSSTTCSTTFSEL